MQISYRRRLERLSAKVPSAGRLLDAILPREPYEQYRILGDTTVRCAAQHAQVQVETGERYGLSMETCERIFTEAIRALDDSQVSPLNRKLTDRLGEGPRDGWIWNEGCVADPFGKVLADLLQDEFGGVRPCSPDEGEMATLIKGVRLLKQLLPRSSGSALSHTHIVAIFPSAGLWRTRMSSSDFRLSGTVFLGRRVVGNPWLVAEHLYHEALHQQFYDFRAGHLLLKPDFVRKDAPLIHSPWSRPDVTRNSYWDVHRALAAFHVYVHLALLCVAVEQNAALTDEFGPVVMVGPRTAVARAHYLSEQIRKVAWDELGPAGQKFLEWFEAILDILNPSPPAPGADVHLLLDRYWHEATHLRTLAGDRYESAKGLMLALAEDEAQSARDVLAAIDHDMSAFDQAMVELSRQEPNERFISARWLIARTILEATPDDYRLSKSGIADGLVRQMVERSSKALQPVLDG